MIVMATQHAGRASALPSAALIESAIRRLSRDALADLCEQLIDRLDRIDGDSDLEETDAEDSFALSRRAQRHGHGAGCIIADPDEAVDDKGCDQDTDSEPRDHGKLPCRYGIDQRAILPPHAWLTGIAYRHD